MAQEEVYYVAFDEDRPAFIISRDDDAAGLVWWKLEKLPLIWRISIVMKRS